MLLHRSATTLAFAFLVGAMSPPSTEVIDSSLRPQTLEAFTHYVQAAESRIQRELARPEAFLYLEGIPEPKRSEALGAIRRGEIYMERLEMRDASGAPIGVPDGLIHHWLGAVFIPGVRLPQIMDLVQDYDHHQDIYRPEVVRSRLIKREG